MTSLRERQKDIARQSIVEACAALVTERHLLDFSMKEVADRAGVSLRTVYNHYETREDLLVALGQEFDRRSLDLGGPSAIDMRDLNDVLAAIATNARIFEELGGVSEAFAQMPLADVGRDRERMIRTGLIVSFIASCMPEVDSDQAVRIAKLIRHILSHRSWFWLTREYGLDADEFADLTIWATRTLIEAARRGDLPTREETT